jgi:hypothetical protein
MNSLCLAPNFPTRREAVVFIINIVYNKCQYASDMTAGGKDAVSPGEAELSGN